MIAAMLCLPVAMLLQQTPDAGAPAAPPPVQVTPYGLMVANFFGNSLPVVNQDAPTAAATGPGISAIGASARQSRFGLIVNSRVAAEALGAKSVDALLELDFFGGYFPTNNQSFYAPLPRLRLFHGSISFSSTKIVFGQDWVLFAPLNPDSLNHMGIPGFGQSGNLWARSVQARLEQKLGPVTIAAGVFAPVDSAAVDASVLPAITVFRNPGAGERSMTPMVQGRIEVGAKPWNQPMALGVSGTYSRESLPNAGPTVDCYGAAAHLNIPLGTIFALKGEAFIGQNLDGFQSFAGLTGTSSTKVMGGWAQASFKPGKLGLHLGAGAEDPQAPDGQTFASGAVDLNLAIYAAITYEIAPKLKIGFEYNRLQTTRAVVGLAVSNHYNLSAQLAF